MSLEEIEGLAQALFEETGDAMFLFDPDTDRVLNVNSAAQRLTGFNVQKLLHMTVTELFRAATDEAERHLHQATRKTSVFHARDGYFLQTVREGVRVPVNLTMARLHVRPKTLGLLTARDVRRQHQALAQLKTVEGELRRVLAGVSDCLWSARIDASGKCHYQFISPGVEQIAGLPPNFFLSGIHRWWSVVHPEDQPRWTRALAQQRAGRSTQEEYRVVWPDGTSRWVRETVRVSRGTAESGTVQLEGVITDVNDRQLAELRFQGFMDGIPGIAFIKDAQGRYLYANQGFQRIVGHPGGDVKGKRDADLFPAEILGPLRENDAAALASNQPLRTFETRPAADGSLRPWVVFRFPLPEKCGSRTMGGVALDLAALQRPEEQSRSA